ncbi:MAG TPA: PEP-CTERM sorting domain-containing protein [Desulfobacterales bacterium]|nr:PEP-CTERM sorting domain-containing protein [Desulfobacterales bacterium]
MKKILLAGLATGLGLIAFAGSAYALSTVNYVNGTTSITPGITTNVTTGEDMAGMKVTALFNDGSSEAETWVSDGIGSKSGGVTGSSWSLIQGGTGTGPNKGDTMSNVWTFTATGNATSNIKSLFIDAGPGKTVFDVISSPEDTPNSSAGRAISWNPDYTPWNISATYSGLVALSGQQPEGDLYRYLSINFSNYTAPGDTFKFLADTDTTTGNINPVPEPATMLLLGTGLAGIAGTMRRRKKNA